MGRPAINSVIIDFTTSEFRKYVICALRLSRALGYLPPPSPSPSHHSSTNGRQFKCYYSWDWFLITIVSAERWTNKNFTRRHTRSTDIVHVWPFSVCRNILSEIVALCVCATPCGCCYDKAKVIATQVHGYHGDKYQIGNYVRQRSRIEAHRGCFGENELAAIQFTFCRRNRDYLTCLTKSHIIRAAIYWHTYFVAATQWTSGFSQ